MPATTDNYLQLNSFYPQHDVPSAPAHRHWLVTDGEGIPDPSAVMTDIQKI